jgi:hypothetical protein
VRPQPFSPSSSFRQGVAFRTGLVNRSPPDFLSSASITRYAHRLRGSKVPRSTRPAISNPSLYIPFLPLLKIRDLTYVLVESLISRYRCACPRGFENLPLHPITLRILLRCRVACWSWWGYLMWAKGKPARIKGSKLIKTHLRHRLRRSHLPSYHRHEGQSHPGEVKSFDCVILKRPGLHPSDRRHGWIHRHACGQQFQRLCKCPVPMRSPVSVLPPA